MLHHKLALVLLLASLGGCGSKSEVVEYDVDKVFTLFQTSEISRAASDWNLLTTHRDLVQVRWGTWLVVRADIPDGFNGYAQKRWSLIRIKPDVPDDLVYAVVLHEFGHALGLRHTRSGIMCGDDPDAGFVCPDRSSTEFTPEVINECRHAKACD